MPYWAAQLHAQRLALATHLLAERGYSVYVPMIASERRRGAIEPLFPSYAFIVVQTQWSPARYCPGVLRLISNGADGQPATIGDGVVDAIRRRERKGWSSFHRRRGFGQAAASASRAACFLAAWASSRCTAA